MREEIFETNVLQDCDDAAEADESRAVAWAAPRIGYAEEIDEKGSETPLASIWVQCEKCGRRLRTRFYPYVPHSLHIALGGGALAPFLREIVEMELGAIPDLIPCDPPDTVPFCRLCREPARVYPDGYTFRKKGYRGKLKTIGREGGFPTPELEPSSTYDKADQILSVAALRSRYGKEIREERRQSCIRERLFKTDKIKEANSILSGLSVRQIQQRWGIPKTTAARAKEGIALLAREAALVEDNEAEYWGEGVGHFFESANTRFFK